MPPPSDPARVAAPWDAAPSDAGSPSLGPLDARLSFVGPAAGPSSARSPHAGPPAAGPALEAPALGPALGAPAAGPALGGPPAADAVARRLLRRRVRLARRRLGRGPYLDYGCGRGDLLALLASRGSATGYTPDPVLAELARVAAPGCPVFTNAEALPAGVFRGLLAVTTTPPDAATLATWRRVLAVAGRVLVVGVALEDSDGFAVRWTGRERWRGAPAVVLESASSGHDAAAPRPG